MKTEHDGNLLRTLGVLLLAVGLLAGCADEPRVAPTGEVGENPPDQELFGSTITDTSGGARRWVLDSERLERWERRDDAELYGVHMRFFRADTLFSTLTSRRGKANLKTNDLYCWGAVVVQTRDGRRLETEELYYDDSDGLITNSVFNRFIRGGDVMTGVGMVATPELDYFELKTDVDAVVEDNGDAGGAP